MELAEPGPPRSLRPSAGPALVSAPQGGTGKGQLGLLRDCQAPALPSDGRLCSFTNGSSSSGALGSTGLSATRAMGTGRMRLFGALILFQMEKIRESCTVFFLSSLLFYTEQKSKKHAGSESADPPRDGPEAGDAGAIAQWGFV